MNEKTDTENVSNSDTGFKFAGISENKEETKAADAVAESKSTDVTADNADAVLDVMTTGVEAEQPESKPDEGTSAEGSGEEAPKLPAWMAQLPEDLRNDKALSQFTKMGDLAKAYKELALKKDNEIVMPGENAKPEEVEAFYQKLGKPEKAEGYKIEGDKADAFKALAYKINLTQNQASSLFSELNKAGQMLRNSYEQKLKTDYANTNNALKAEYGNEYGNKMKLLQKGLQTYGGKEVVQKLYNAGLSYDSDIVHLFIKLGEQAQEAGSVLKGNAGSSTYKSNRDGGMFNFKGL